MIRFYSNSSGKSLQSGENEMFLYVGKVFSLNTVSDEDFDTFFKQNFLSFWARRREAKKI